VGHLGLPVTLEGLLVGLLGEAKRIQKPMGGRAPGRSSALNALRLEDALPTWAGAKAAAEPTRAREVISFIIILSLGWLLV